MLPRARRPRRNPFERRTQLWRELGLGSEIDAEGAQRARGAALILICALAGVLVLFNMRDELFPGAGTVIRVLTVIALVVLGWALARALGQGFAPLLFRRLDPGTAGTVGFLIRLVTIVGFFFVALRIAGIETRTLALGGALTAVVLGLAAQQTLGNLFAGMVLLTARPFRVGERVRLVGGSLAGQIEGIVGSLGLFYTTLVRGSDRILVPNSILLQLAVIPLREPERVDMRARFSATVTPAEIQQRLAEQISVPTRRPPDIQLEEVDGEEVVVRIAATPLRTREGAELAAQVLAAIRAVGSEIAGDGAVASGGDRGPPA